MSAQSIKSEIPSKRGRGLASDLRALPQESADYLRAQDDRVGFLSGLLLEHKRRNALNKLLENHLADVAVDQKGEEEALLEMDSALG